MSNCKKLFGLRPTLIKGRPFFILFSSAMLLLSVSTSVFAQSRQVLLDEETKAVCNKVMLNIYYKVLADKAKFPELAQFGESNFFENDKEIYAIVYQWTEDAAKKSPFEFGITIVPYDNKIFQDQGRYAFNLEFPFLGLKFAGYIKKAHRNRYSVMDAINTQGTQLSDYQQKFVPLQLVLEANKKEFKVKEPIQFDVELKNASKRHMWVKAITEDTLYCLFDKHYWGAQAKGAPKQEKFILKAGESSKRTFLGRGITEPKEVEVYCSYGMSLEGVKPSGVLKLKIVP